MLRTAGNATADKTVASVLSFVKKIVCGFFATYISIFATSNKGRQIQLEAIRDPTQLAGVQACW